MLGKMKYLLLTILLTACTQPGEETATFCADYSEIEDTDNALEMCEADVNDAYDELAAKNEELAELRAVIDSMVADSHECRGALIECGCGDE